MTLNPRLEQVKSVEIRDASCWESVPQSAGSWEEVTRVDLMEYKGNEAGQLQCAWPCRV